jgi:hypothetical protein
MNFIQIAKSVNISYHLFIYKTFQKFSYDISDIPDEVPSNSTEVVVLINNEAYLIDTYQDFKSGASDQNNSEIYINFSFLYPLESTFHTYFSVNGL